MSENFKILIAYDGSGYAEAALDDMKTAGFADENVEALVYSVAEVWLPPADENGEHTFVTDDLRRKYETNLAQFEQAKEAAQKAAERVKIMFPNWTISSDATYGSAGWEILAKAEELQTNLIVAGAQGETDWERVLLGSVSQKIVTEAECSVRIARGKVEVNDTPTRIIVAYDGSNGADEAVKKVRERNWKTGSEARVVIVGDTAFTRNSLDFDEEKINRIGAEIVEKLNSENLSATLIVREGNPKKILVEEAENWSADCIFVGAANFEGFVAKYLLGSVSSAIVTRASCSVEVIRP